MPGATNIIYGLVDPRTSMVRYIGLSSKGLARPRQHRKPSSFENNTYKSSWVSSLHKQGLDFEIVVLQESTLESLNDDERWWIAYGRISGWPLTNMTEGGDGMLGRICTDETRARMSASGRGRAMPPVSEETKNKIGNANRGKVRSPELRALWSKLALGRRVSPEAREKIRRASTGRKHTDEARAKMSAAQVGRTFSAETIEKMAATHRGVPLTAEHRAKIGAATLGKVRGESTKAKMRAAWVVRRERMNASKDQ